MQITDTEISSNSAVGVATLASELLNDEVFSLAGEKIRDMVGNGISDMEGIEFITNCGHGGGGGVCFVLNQIPQRALAEVVVARTAIKENTAINGGEFPIS